MSASSSSVVVSPPLTKYDVFLSFRGEDTRDGFTSYLYAALRMKHIETYRDDEIRKGEEISPALQKAIEESKIYVIIFSKNYASSTWCLDELTKILECKRYGRVVIPVFYKVDPSNVRHQRESYAEAFVKHEQRFKGNVDKVQAWKAALTEAAGLSGWDSERIRPEYELVEGIVKDILKKLNSFFSSDDYQGKVGIDKHIEQIQSMLYDEPAVVRIIGIGGVGGIGKTTIAQEIYRKLATQFSYSSFVANVQEKIKRKGIHCMQGKLLSKLLHEENRSDFSNERLKRAKVLLILDDVNNSCQLKDLIGGHDNFGPGSRIIVTSRDMQVLENADIPYEVKEMNFQDSLELFSLNAFKQRHPIETYMELSVKVLDSAKRIPLALKVLGSLLAGKTKEEWEDELRKLKKLPAPEIFDVMKLSYDGLDANQKSIFLDIACFFKGHYQNTVKQILDSCGFFATIGMRVLIDRGLMFTLGDKIMMHDLIQEMGQEIVRRQCDDNPRKCSRLWRHEDIYRVLSNNKGKGTDAIQCIFLDMCQIKEVQLHAKTFKKMHNLRILQFYNSIFHQPAKVHIPTFLESLPDELRFLRWDDFPQRYLPLDFRPENLVELVMRHSNLEQLWDKDQHLRNLKKLDLSGSWKLSCIPDLSRCPNIEEIMLFHCRKLDRVYSSNFLSKLNCLWLSGCLELVILNVPSNILSSSSGLIILDNCHNLETFSVGNVPFHGCSRRKSFKKSQQVPRRAKEREFFSNTFFDPIYSADIYEARPMDRSQMGEKVWPSLFPRLNKPCWLDLSNCESLTSLPIDLYKMKSLSRLYLSGCSNLEEFPEIKEAMENLTVVILDRTAIQKLPSSLDRLVGLEELSLHGCQKLELIPPSIGSLSKLCKLDLTYCESLETLPSSVFNLKLTKLDLHGCSMLTTFPEIMAPAESFAHLRLTKTKIKQLPSSLKYLVGLQTLRLNLCKDLEFFPNSIGNVNLLSELDLSGCEKLVEIPNDIGRFSSLRELSLHESGIVNLPESITHLSSLKSLDLSDCKMLECIPALPPFLKQLSAFDCPSIRRVSSSTFNLPSDSKERVFKFHFTNSQELDPSAHSNIVDDAWRRIREDAYRSVFFCFPGSAIPHWFRYRCKGHSVTLNKDSLNWCNDNRFIGFALCVVFGVKGMGDEGKLAFSYRFRFESDDGTNDIPSCDQLRNFFIWKGQHKFIVKDHTFLWKYHLEPSSFNRMLSHAHNFTFEICECKVGFRSSKDERTVTVKECGIRPLYSKEKDDNVGAGDYSNFLRFSNNDIEDPVGAKPHNSFYGNKRKRG